MNHYYNPGDPRPKKPQKIQLCSSCAEDIRVAYEGKKGFELDLRYHIGTPAFCESCGHKFPMLDMYHLEYGHD